MSLPFEEFEALVRRTEAEATESPSAYKLRVLVLAVLPYVYVFSALALALALIGVLVASVVLTGQTHGGFLKLAAKGSWALGLLVYAVLRALWIKSEEPEGFVLERDAYPKLFEEIDAVRAAVGAPPAHVVMLDADFNAAISQHSRFGLLGWQKNYLYLGLPLMRALSPVQFRAVLAHEFGHLAGSHGRISAWIYRSRTRWGALLGELEKQDHWASFVFRPFLRWYAPYFHAYSFVRARSNEYDADRAAAEATSARDHGDALLALGLRNIQLEENYWPSIGVQMDERPEPDVSPHAAMRFTALEPETAKSWIDSRLAEETGIADTHPSLSDRLAALEVSPRIPPLAEQSAAEAWFGESLPTVAAVLDAGWREWIGDRWRNHYESLRVQRERLVELDAKVSEPLSEGERWEHAQLVEDLRSVEEALPMYRALLEPLPDSMNVNFSIGRILVAQQDAAGVAFIERAIELNDAAIVPGSQWVVPFLRSVGREAEADVWIERWKAHQEKLDEDERDRSKVWFDEHYTVAGVPEADRAAIVAFLATLDDVDGAWLLQRKTLHYPERPMYVLIVHRKASFNDWFSEAKEKAADSALQDALSEGPGLEGGYRILVTNRLERKHRRRMEGFEGTEIYRRAN
jgi:Zn-dependent protease with chaperone function